MTLELTAKVTLILCLVVAGSLLLRRSSAAARHLVQVFGLCAVLVLPVAAIALPVWELPLLRPSTPQAVVRAEAGAAPGQQVTLAPRPPRDSSRPRATEGEDCRCDGAIQDLPYRPVGEEPLQIAGAPAFSGPAPPGLGAAGWATLLWGLGALCVLGRLAFHWLRMTTRAIEAAPLADRAMMQLVLTCCCRLGLQRVPRVLVSRRIDVPVLWGFLRPTLMLPESSRTWSRDRLRVVLLHELAHLRRFDGAALLLGRVAAAVWWFHPMVWIVERWTRRDCERACDDAVLACGERPSNYARHLLEIARELPAAPAAALAITGSSGPFEHRVRSILSPDLRRGVGRRAALVALVSASLLLTSVASAKLVARESTPQPVEALRVHEAEPSPEPVLQAGGIRAEPTRAEYLLAHDDHSHEGESEFDRASELHREEQWEEASALFEKAAAMGYREGTALYNAACGRARLGHERAAIELIERSLEAGFDSHEHLLQDNDLDPIRSAPQFRALLDRMNEDGEFDRWPARDRYEEAVEHYEDLLDERSEDAGEWYEVGSDLLSLREFDRGVEALERAAGLEDRNQSALYNLACAYALQGDASTALDRLEQSVLAGFERKERFRNDSDLDSIRDERRFAGIEKLHDTLSLERFRLGRSDSNYSSRRWAPAIEEFRKFTAERPEVGRGWFNLGWALHFSRRHDEARDAFQRQRALGYRADIATYNIACAYAMEGNVDEALNWLDRAVDTGRIGAHQLASDEDLDALHDDERFEALLERAVELNEEHGWVIRKKKADTQKVKIKQKTRSRQY
ncbi:MAG: tetratricopeptide repeat protein [bacterium]|nr:tetratricopeptide repeat protein [bacterium]